MDEQAVLQATRAWVEHAVIGLNLCPFAKAVQTKNLIRYVCSDARDTAALLDALRRELQRLADTPIEQLETTLLVHPQVLGDFLDYNDFLDEADALLCEMGLDGTLQIASFHPQYQFAGTRGRRHRERHQPLALPHAAPAARGQHRARGGRLPRARGHLRDQQAHAARAGAEGLGGAAGALPARPGAGAAERGYPTGRPPGRAPICCGADCNHRKTTRRPHEPEEAVPRHRAVRRCRPRPARRATPTSRSAWW